MVSLVVNVYLPIMNIQITGESFNVSDRTRKLIEEKVNQHLEKLLHNFSPEMKTAQIRISKDKLKNFIVNFDMELPGKEQVFAKTTHRILKSALIDLTQAVERQIIKYKETV